MALFSRFTEKSHQVIVYAEKETRRLYYRYICTTQIFLGLIRQKTGLAAQVLTDAGIYLENARLEVEKIQKPGDWNYTEISFNNDTRLVFELSVAEADQLKDSEIDTHHLLLGLLKQSEGGAIKVLQNLGVDPTQLRIQVLRKLAAQGHRIASELLPTPTPANSDETSRIKSQLDLIQELIQSPEGSLAEVVKSHPGSIINSALIEGVASILEQQGVTKTAEYLRGLVAPISKENVETSDNLPETPVNVPKSVPISTQLKASANAPELIELPVTPEVVEPISTPPKEEVTQSESKELPPPPEEFEPVVDVPTPSNQELKKFLFQLLRVSFESKANEQEVVVHNFLRENLDKLSDRFPEVLRNFALSKLASIDRAEKPKWAKRILKISSLVRKFEGGNREINLEIALTGYKIVAPIFSETEYPQQWGNIQNCLGLTYLDRVKGDQKENFQQAEACFIAALKIYNHKQFPQQRKIIVKNFKKAVNQLEKLLQQGEQNSENQIIEDEVLNLEQSSVNPDRLSPEMHSQDTERNQKYLYLIEELLRSPQGQYQTILDDNSELLDTRLIEMMRQRAEAEKNMGSIQNAELLINFSVQINETLGWSSLTPCSDEQLSQVGNQGNSRTRDTSVVVVSKEEERQEVYQNFIEQLLACQSGQWQAILIGNYDLIDARLVRKMEQTAATMRQDGEENAANFLEDVATRLAMQLSEPDFMQSIEQVRTEFAEMDIQNPASFLSNLYTQMLATIADLSLTVSPEEYFTFMGSLFQVITESMDDPKTIYPFLAANEEKLDDNFAKILQVYTISMVQKATPYYAQGIANIVCVFSYLMVNFPLGKKAINIEIAITGYEIAGTVFTREVFPKEWADLQNNLGIAYCQRIQGDRADNLEMAIAKYQDALKVRTSEAYPSDWAATQMNLGIGYYQRIKGEQANNLEDAIQMIKSALTVYTREANPEQWAMAQSNLGEVYRVRIRGERAENQEQAIQYFKAALTVYTLECFRTQWAMIQSHLGNVYSERIRGEQTDNVEQAIEFFEATLTIYTPSTFPFDWARIQSNLGIAYLKRCGNKAENIELGIRYFEAALTIYTPETFPLEWAMAQTNLSNLYIERIKGEKAENIERAIQLCQAALSVRIRETLPIDWAETQLTLGNAFSARIRDEKAENWERAIQAYQSALTVFTDKNFPQEWGMLQHNLSRAYMNRIRDKKADNLEQAIQAGEAALIVRTRKAFPVDWAMTQDNLARVYSSRIRGEKADNLERAIQAGEAALTIYTRSSFPEYWAGIQMILGSVYVERIRGEKAKSVEKAIKACEAALTIYTRESFPQKWAVTQATMSIAYRERIQGKRVENIEQSIQACEAALTILTWESFPEDWAKTQINLGISYQQRINGDRADNLERSLAALEASLTFYTPETDSTSWALAQANLSAVYLNRVKGEYAENKKRSLQASKAALTIYTPFDFPEQWAKIQINLAAVYREQPDDQAKKLELAIQACEAALTVYTPSDFPEKWAFTQLNLGTIYAERLRGVRADNLEQAIASYETALTIFTAESFPENSAMLHMNLGNVYRQRLRGKPSDNLERAMVYYRSALQFFTRTTNPRLYAKILFLLGFTYLKAKQFHRAYGALKSAIKTLELLRGEVISGDQVKSKLSHEMFLIYQLMIKVCLELAETKPDYYTKALEYAERGKARNLVELLASRNLLPKGNVTEAVVNELQRLRLEITSEQRRLDNAKANSAVNSIIGEAHQSLSNPPVAIVPDRTHLNQLQQQLDNLIARDIQHIDPNFSSTQKVNPISFSEIQSLLPNKNTVIIEWFLGIPSHLIIEKMKQDNLFTEGDITGTTLFTFITTYQSQTPVVLQSPENNFEALWEWHHEYWKAYFKQKEQWKNQLLSRLKRLAEILQIDHIISHIPETCEQLILIPHSILHLYPLHALPLSKNECLVERFSGGIRYAPSCQLLQISENQQRENFNQFFAIQNPNNDLEYTNIEVEVIRQNFKPNDDVLIKDAAKKEAINNQRIHSTHCAHFSCHGYFNLEKPLLSALILADGKTSEESQQSNKERYLLTRSGDTLDLEKCLTLGEIFDLDLSQCRIVALSACETGIIDFNNFTEYINLSSGFLYAGSPSIVTSLWTVDDVSTTFLMIKFYEILDQQWKEKNELNVAIALNQAQLWLRDVTTAKLQEWTSKLELEEELIEQIYDELEDFNSDEQPYQKQFYWAGFCAVGK